MRVIHNTRDHAYRTPYGAVPLGSSVDLYLDVADASDIVVRLRTWVDGVGEQLYDMQACSQEAVPAGFERFHVCFTPFAAGVVWYQFAITDAEGFVWHYGAHNRCLGGEGQLVGWLPPSFCLAVFDCAVDAPAWHAPLAMILPDQSFRSNKEELIASLLENYPFALCATSTPWDVDAASETHTPEVFNMTQAYEKARAESKFVWFAVNNDTFGFWRQAKSGAMTCALFNASPYDSYHVLVPMVGEEASELVTGYGVPVLGLADLDDCDAERMRSEFPEAQQFVRVFLGQLGSAILHFHAHNRFALPLEKGMGILAHITSLPTDGDYLGTLGKPAFEFIDWLADQGVCYWQVLPVNPTDEFGSPYAGISAFAGNSLLLEQGQGSAGDQAVQANPDAYQVFCECEADWLEPYVSFMALRDKFGEGTTWQEWPHNYRSYDATLIAADKQLSAAAEFYRHLQFAFQQQGCAVRDYAHQKGIALIGDMPLYVSADSADVWANPLLFQLGDDGTPQVVAGCPPDAFAAEGQIWGNPVYDWDYARDQGYSWWLRRLQRAFDLYDYVRLDHFIGFSRYFSIPVGKKAVAGSYRLGPGFEFFSLAYEKLGRLPVIAEDLGLLTPRVRGLVADCGFLGMDIIQFADSDPLVSYEPRPNKVVYTGTHDNQTLLGFARSRYGQEDAQQISTILLEKVVSNKARVRIVALQDLLGLGDEARMNVPGIAGGNWSWQADDLK